MPHILNELSKQLNRFVIQNSNKHHVFHNVFDFSIAVAKCPNGIWLAAHYISDDQERQEKTLYAHGKINGHYSYFVL